MYWRTIPYWEVESQSTISRGLPDRKSNPRWTKLVLAFLTDLMGCMRALYTVSRPECPHCFYCGKPATRRIGERDLCERHSQTAAPLD